MSRVFERTIPGQSASRAFVIGVGAYPRAKRNHATPATPQPLRNVSDIDSAAFGAALFTDWLISHADQLSAPLASVDLLLNVNVGPTVESVYSWKGRVPSPADGDDPRPDTMVGAPDTPTVKAVGGTWKSDLTLGANNQAIFYICGHGAKLGADNVVFLSDLNGDAGNPWGALINIQNHARAFKQIGSLRSAAFFVDACAELVIDIELQNPGVGAQFAYSNPRAVGDEKVTVLAAAAPNRLSYEGTLPDEPTVTAGRFTQCLIQALRGAAVRDISGRGRAWAVHQLGIYQDLDPLYGLRPDWNDFPFEPTAPMLPNRLHPIVQFPQAPVVPVRIRFEPPQIDQWALAIRDDFNAIFSSRAMGAADDWLTGVPASLQPYTLAGWSDTKSVSQPLSLIQGLYDQALEVAP